MTMKGNKVRYSYDDSALDFLIEHNSAIAYRRKVDPCPYCQKEIGAFQKCVPLFKWMREGNVREVVFTRNKGMFRKKGYVMVISACPRCEKLSFHHWPIGTTLREDWADREIVQAEIDAWEQESLDEWNNSLCARCDVKKTVKENKYGYSLECDGRSVGPADPLETTTFRCKNYVPVVQNTCFGCGKKFDKEDHPENMHEECADIIKEKDRISHIEWVEDMKRLGWNPEDKKEDE